MKVLLQKKFDQINWAQTYEIRHLDIAKKMKMVSLHSQWPCLFSIKGVINYFIRIILI